MVSEVTQTLRACAPGGVPPRNVWQTKRGRAASTGRMSGMRTAGESRLGPPSAPFPWSSPLGPSTAG